MSDAPPPPRFFTPEEDEQLWRRHTSGEATLAEIGKSLGRTRDAVARRMKKLRELNAARKANLAKQAASKKSPLESVSESQASTAGRVLSAERARFTLSEDALIIMALYEEKPLDALKLNRTTKDVAQRAVAISGRMRAAAVDALRIASSRA